MKATAVSVAQDILERLDELNCRRQVYLCSDTQYFDVDSDLTNEAVFSSLSEDNCQACALGACFLSLFHLQGQASKLDQMISRIGNYRSLIGIFAIIKDNLLTVFSEEELCLIEIAYECRCNAVPSYDIRPAEEEQQKALQFGLRFSEPKDRLRVIMENVISNNGNFIP